MTELVIHVPELVAAAARARAQRRGVTVDRYVEGLIEKDRLVPETVTSEPLQQLVASIKASTRKPIVVREAVVDRATLQHQLALSQAPFDWAEWNDQWQTVAQEMKRAEFADTGRDQAQPDHGRFPV